MNEYTVTFKMNRKKIIVLVMAKNERKATSRARTKLHKRLGLTTLDADPFKWEETKETLKQETLL